MKKKKIIGIVSFFLLAGVFSFLVISGSPLVTSDGYTRLGSELGITEQKLVGTLVEGTTCPYETCYQSSKFWNSVYTRTYTSSTSPFSEWKATGTDQAIRITGNKFNQNNVEGTICFTERINGNKLKFDINYDIAGSSSGGASVIAYLSSEPNPYAQKKSIIETKSVNGGSKNRGTESSSFGVEVVPNLFDNTTSIEASGIEKDSVKRDEPLYICFAVSNGEMTIKNTRYQPILGYAKAPTDMFAIQTFKEGQVISLDKFKYGGGFVKQFPYGSQSIKFIKGNNAIDDILESNRIYNQLAYGKEIIVPEGYIWVVPYVFDNSKGLVQVNCGENPVDENGICQQQTGLVYALSSETVDTNTGTITATAENVCTELFDANAVFLKTEGICRSFQPVLDYCDNDGVCEARVSTICENNNLKYNEKTFSCEAPISTETKQTGEIIIKEQINWKMYSIIGAVVILLLIIFLIMAMRGKKRR